MPTEADAGTPPPALRLQGVHKRYGGVHALRGARLTVAPGEVHGLTGANGSGKSTMLRILSGQTRPDAGVLELHGRRVGFATPREARLAGVATVTQETTLVPDLTVGENVLLGRGLVRRRGGIDWAASHRRADAVLARLGIEVDSRLVARGLRPNQRQLVEIARALSVDCRLLILDEPTSSLTDDEVAGLMDIVRSLRRNGVSSIFVSHRMGELFALCDRFTVLRDGCTVAEEPATAFDPDSLVEEMVGTRATRPVRRSARRPDADRVRLRLTDVAVEHAVRDVSLEVRAGEVVGLAGLTGAGHHELFEGLFNLRRTEGRIEVDGRPVRRRTPAAAMAGGLAYVPADRKEEGLMFDMTVRENLLMAATTRLRRLRPFGRDEERRATRLVDELGVVCGGLGTAVGTLSGGNQQKVLLGRWLATAAPVLLLDEPTRGVDVGAKREIARLLERAREQGTAMLVSSSESAELLALCDRIVVLFRGRPNGEFIVGEADEAAITRAAMGHAA